MVTGFLLVTLVVFKLLFGERERIRTLFRIYLTAKKKFPQKTERELLEIVVEEFIPHGKGVKLKNTGVTGKRYIEHVFEERPLDVDILIEHIVALESPQKYRCSQINLEEMLEKARTGKMSKRDKLKFMVKNYHQKYLA